jgi:hypothetical protein
MIQVTMVVRRAKFNKSQRICMSIRHIDDIDRMRRQRRRKVRRGPTSSRKSAAAQ